MVDLDKPVRRTHLGERVQWNYGGKIRHATVTWIGVEDSNTYEDDGYTKRTDGLSHDGLVYFGRVVRGRCDERKCECVTRAEFGCDHVWNECQLTPSDDLGPIVREVALW